MSNNSFLCPFCNNYMSISNDTHRQYVPYFNSSNQNIYGYDEDAIATSSVVINFFKCPKCNKYTILAQGIGKNVKNHLIHIYPNSIAKQYPEYIPLAIRNDYEEAYSILDLSPKASATLSRRCLQGMIRDFYKISMSNLFEEINAIKSLIPPSQWQAIDATRSIGNIGAHMEKDVNVIIDVDPGEAEQLLKLIELLIDKWYIARHDEEELYKSIVGTAQSKKNQKQANSN